MSAHTMWCAALRAAEERRDHAAVQRMGAAIRAALGLTHAYWPAVLSAVCHDPRGPDELAAAYIDQYLTHS